jgi:hypothetical protein
MKNFIVILVTILTVLSCGRKEENRGTMMSYTITYKVYYNHDGMLKTRTIDSYDEVRYNLRSNKGSNNLSFVTGKNFFVRKVQSLESTSAPIEVLSFIKHDPFVPKTTQDNELKLTYILSLPGVEENVVLPYTITKETWQKIANCGIKEELKINVIINGIQMFYISYNNDENESGK